VDERRGDRQAEDRTFLAQERTLLAWWRSGLASLTVALAVGRLLPALLEGSSTAFALLGAGFAILGLAFIAYGSVRDRVVGRELARGAFRPVDRWIVWTFTGFMAMLALVTIALSAGNL
jgi:putative membrane protein